MPFDALRLAAGLLSVLPTGRLPEPRPGTYRRAMLLAPLAVLPLALLAGLVFAVGSLAGLPAAVVGLLTVGALALGTRALHLDGLADTVDGLGTGWDPERELVKLAPLFDWSRERVAAACAELDVPVNALHGQGFLSIGCEPCTRALKPGEPERAGRWWWEQDEKKECGLHRASPVNS